MGRQGQDAVVGIGVVEEDGFAGDGTEGSEGRGAPDEFGLAAMARVHVVEVDEQRAFALPGVPVHAVDVVHVAGIVGVVVHFELSAGVVPHDL